MGEIREMAERMWNGEVRSEDLHPLTVSGVGEEVSEGVYFYHSFSNVVAFRTDDGLVMVDTGTFFGQKHLFDSIREWSDERLDTAIYTHGHVDHVFGVPPFAEEARRRGWPPPRVVAHERVPHRFRRYVLTAGWNAFINLRQFRGTSSAGADKLRWPTNYVFPDTTFSERLTTRVGGVTFELHHDRGQTDDQTWVWLPDSKVLCPGDFFEWAAPNAGNPQKVQRYPQEWAVALEKMAALGAESMLPGHGAPIFGADRIAEALLDTAEYLRSIHDQTVALMNEGATLDDVLATVRPPAHLEQKPYLKPLYDEPEYIARNVWRLYGGWYDGVPSNLKPARRSEIARAVADLAGGVDAVVERASQLAQQGELALASDLADWAVEAAPDHQGAQAARARIYARRAEESTASMTRGIFQAASRESAEVAGGREGH